jgi:hypothetical protein
VATALAVLDQVTVRPVSVFPLASLAVAVSCTVWPGVSDAVVGVSVTDATAAWATDTPAVPLLPPLVAVIVAVPVATAVTCPPLATETTLLLLLAQVTVRPASTVPLASFSVAVSCAVAPTVRLLVAGDTVTVATGAGDGAATVTLAVPLIPSLDAVIMAAPIATAVTIPLDETVATLVFEDDHVTARPVSTVPLASSVVAVSGVNWLGVSEAEEGDTRTVATGAGAALTVAAAVAVTRPAVAEICVDPAATSVTIPESDTVAIDGFDDDHVTVAVESGCPLVPVTVAATTML